MWATNPQAGSFGAHKTTGSQIRRSHNYRVRSIRSSFVPQILEQKRDCSQSTQDGP